MQKYDFSEGWMFQKEGGIKSPVLLPHDATQTEERSEDAPSLGAGAFYPGGMYIYTKTFIASSVWEKDYASLLFEGVYPSAEVFLNGKKVVSHAYGYTQFEVPLTEALPGKENEITVVVDHTRLPDSRWYAGAGIYRPVWLLESGRSHIPFQGVRVETRSWEEAEIQVRTKVCGSGNVKVEILDGESLIVTGYGRDCILRVPDGKCWSPDYPYLYRCRVTLWNENELLDTEEVRFGIRKISWNTKGLFVNGEETLLKGGCIHADNGILGARSFPEAEYRRIRRLKEYGFNAIRSAHNPLSESALAACDELGMYVMDESWDMWEIQKTSADYGGRFRDHWKEDLAAMIQKDYNHPSVILYSIGNEITDPAKPEGMKLARDLYQTVKTLDPTRVVTAGINIALLWMTQQGYDFTGGEDEKKEVGSTEFNEMAATIADLMEKATVSPEGDAVSSPVLDLLDIAGFNYASARYETEPQLHPDRIVVGSETYPQDLPRNWKMVEDFPWVIGDFMWTAWDYLGEVGIGSWVRDEKISGFAKPFPYKLGEAGALDILGNETAEAGMAAVIWNARENPYIAVQPLLPEGETWYPAAWRGSNAIPSWSFSGCEGWPAVVEVYTKAKTVSLYLNGRLCGTQKPEDYKAVFRIVYEPGELKAAANYEDGSIRESVLHSAEGKRSIHIVPETKPCRGELLFLDIDICGENGEIESNQDETLQVSVEGGTLVAFGSADPKSADSFLSGRYRTWYGKSLAAVLVEEDTLTITVTGETMQNKARFTDVS